MKPRSSPRRKKPLPKSTSFAKRGGKPKPTNPARRKKAFARAYGSKERVEFVKSLPCLVCGCSPSENAHVGKEGAGAGRKANADQIAALCSRCHAELHRMGAESFERQYKTHLETLMRFTEFRWLASREGEAA